MSRKRLTITVLLLCIFQPISIGFAKDNGLLIYIPAIIHKPQIDIVPLLACPQKQSLFTVVPTHSWTFKTSDEKIVVNGHLPLQNVCNLSILGDLVWGEDCTRTYTNEGTVHTTEDCTLLGESTATISFDGFCEKGVLELTITETQNPDAGLGGEITCPSLEGPIPHVTYYPPTNTRHIITLTNSYQELTDTENEGVGGFTWAKNYIFTNEGNE